jgi:hypothetical protein
MSAKQQDLAIVDNIPSRTALMPEDLFVEDDSPQDVHWASDLADEPTFPEGAWTDKTALVEASLEGQYKYQVKFEGVYWTAIATPLGVQLTLGETVAVLGRDGTELVVQKLPERPPVVDPAQPVASSQAQMWDLDPVSPPLGQIPPPDFQSARRLD